MSADYEADIVVNHLKNFYNQYKTVIFYFSVVLILTTLSIVFYQWSHYRYENRAANRFFELMSLDQSDDKIEQIKSFTVNYKSSPYASLAKLVIIADDLKQGNWQGVDMQVDQITASNPAIFVKDQAYLLQARRFLATRQFEQALNTLDKIKEKNQTIIYVIKGLAENELHRIDASQSSFEKAKNILTKYDPDSTLQNFIWYQQALSIHHE